MQSPMKGLFALLLLGMLALPAGADERLTGLVLVVHPEVPTDQITQRELSRIYLGKSTRWSGGLTIRPVLLERESEYDRFVAEALHRTGESFSVYWKRMVFTGKGRPPRTFDDPSELALYIRVTEGAIGFLPADADLSGLKVMTLD